MPGGKLIPAILHTVHKRWWQRCQWTTDYGVKRRSSSLLSSAYKIIRESCCSKNWLSSFFFPSILTTLSMISHLMIAKMLHQNFLWQSISPVAVCCLYCEFCLYNYFIIFLEFFGTLRTYLPLFLCRCRRAVIDDRILRDVFLCTNVWRLKCDVSCHAIAF